MGTVTHIVTNQYSRAGAAEDFVSPSRRYAGNAIRLIRYLSLKVPYLTTEAILIDQTNIIWIDASTVQNRFTVLWNWREQLRKEYFIS